MRSIDFDDGDLSDRKINREKIDRKNEKQNKKGLSMRETKGLTKSECLEISGI